MSSWIHVRSLIELTYWTHLNPITVGTPSQTASFSPKKDIFITTRRDHIWSQPHLSFVFFQHKACWGNLSVSPSRGSLSGLWTGTHVVNLCLWSGWGTASGQMLRQCSRWPRRIRRRNMPIRLFVLPFFHPAAVQSDLSQLEVKQWMAGKEALNHSSSPEHRSNPVRPCKSLNSFSPRRKRGTENGSKDHLGSACLKFDQKVSKLQIALTWQNENAEVVALWFQWKCKPFYTETGFCNESQDSWAFNAEKYRRTKEM